jgi:threonine/homoserine/homoserine lactone efflux protein
MTLETYFLYLAAVGVFFATSPDTSQLLIIANSARYGLKRGIWTIAGDLTANSIQMTAAAFGLAAIVAASAEAFLWIKWVGVVYLGWIGLKLMLSPTPSGGDGPRHAGQAPVLFRQGFVTSMANPFAVVFFAALFPQFIDPATRILPQLLILGLTYLIVDGTILVLWGWFGIGAARALRRRAGVVKRVCGGLMIAAAVLLASKDLTPTPQR